MNSSLILQKPETGKPAQEQIKRTKLKNLIIEISLCILIVLWIYTAMDKLLDYASYRRSMYLQVFDEKTLYFLVPALPIIELLAAALLIFSRRRKYGFILSLVLMFAFTVYVFIIYLGYFTQRPCSCAGLFEEMSWGAHLVLNTALTVIAFTGLILHLRGKEGAGAV